MTTGGKRDHCKKFSPDLFAWTLQACANKRRRNKFVLCGECDIELNTLVLRFFNHKKAKQLSDAYKANTQAPAG